MINYVSRWTKNSFATGGSNVQLMLINNNPSLSLDNIHSVLSTICVQHSVVLAITYLCISFQFILFDQFVLVKSHYMNDEKWIGHFSHIIVQWISNYRGYFGKQWKYYVWSS